MTNNQTSSRGTEVFLKFFRAVLVVGLLAFAAFTVYGNVTSENPSHPFKLGLDLAGGSHLVYEADIKNIDPLEVPDLMNVLRDVIEQRINIFGVSEPIVYVESSSFVSDVKRERLVVELPGVTDVAQAVAEIGRTPLLEFKLVNEAAAQAQAAAATATLTNENGENIMAEAVADSLAEKFGEPYIETGLTGRYLESAQYQRNANQGGLPESVVAITFTEEGGKLFADITRDNVGKSLAIFLDGLLISAPRINETISGGTAVISGGFKPEDARDLAQNLSFGALPLPISLESTQTVGATLGQGVLDKGIKAGVLGFGLVLLFMVVWYRLPGFIAVIALLGYVVIMLGLFQLIPVTLTAAGLAGFVLSLGMAVDANVLVYERMKEEIRAGKNSAFAAQEGFKRAWGAIRDGNVTSLLSAIILFWFGTSMVKGFALVFGVGIIVSMFSALVITRTLLMALPDINKENNPRWAFLFGSGFFK
jgi:protein-export membrane protein SecD